MQLGCRHTAPTRPLLTVTRQGTNAGTQKLERVLGHIVILWTRPEGLERGKRSV